MEIKDSLLPTSVTYSGEFLSSDAKIPTLFEIDESSPKNVDDNGIMYRDGKVSADDVSNVARGLREEYDKALLEAWNKRKEEVRNDTALDTWEKKQRRLDGIAAAEFGADLYGRDYSGLTSVMDIEDVHDAVEAAYAAVVETEAAHGVSTAKLQEAIKAANAATLDKMFTSGMISRATRDGIGETISDKGT